MTPVKFLYRQNTLNFLSMAARRPPGASMWAKAGRLWELYLYPKEETLQPPKPLLQGDIKMDFLNPN
jgi:hypothetical protein